MILIRLFLNLFIRFFQGLYIITPEEQKPLDRRKPSKQGVPTDGLTTSDSSSSTASTGAVTKTLSSVDVPQTYKSLTPAVTTTSTLRSPLDDTRVSWIYSLNKEDLKSEMAQHGLYTTGKTAELRQRFVDYWKNPAVPTSSSVSEGLPRPSLGMIGTAAAPFFPESEYTYSTYLQKTTEELVNIKEILGLSPNADLDSVRRTLTALVKAGPLPSLNPYTAEHPDSRKAPRSMPSAHTTVTYSKPYLGTRAPHGPQFPSAWRWDGEPRRSTYIQGTRPVHSYEERESSSHDLSTLCNLVRKWNLRFDGRKDPVSFLERLEELMEAYTISQRDILRALSELLHGTSLLWYRNSKEMWTTYAEFRHHFEIQFLPPGYRHTLDDEIRRRTQGESEPFRSYVVAITTLIRRRGTFSIQDKLDLIFSNMRPEYKVVVRRQDFSTLSQLIERAEDYETYIREKSTFRPPPPPAMVLVPETAYYHRKRNDRTTDAATVEHNTFKARDKTSATQKNVLKPWEERERRTKEVTPSSPPGVYSARPGRWERFPENNTTLGPTVQPRHPTPGNNGSRPPAVCWNCNTRGHLYRDCSLPKVLRCYYCKANGVPTTRCPCQKGNGSRIQERGGHLGPRSDERIRPPQSELNGYHEGRPCQSR